MPPASAAAAAEDGAAAALGQSQQTDDGADDADEPAAPTAFLAQRLAAVLGDAILQPARTAPKAPPGGKSTRRTSYAEPSAKSGKGARRVLEAVIRARADRRPRRGRRGDGVAERGAEVSRVDPEVKRDIVFTPLSR